MRNFSLAGGRRILRSICHKNRFSGRFDSVDAEIVLAVPLGDSDERTRLESHVARIL